MPESPLLSAFLRLPPGHHWGRSEAIWSAPQRALAVRGGKLISWKIGAGPRKQPFFLDDLNRLLRDGRWWLLAGYEFSDRLMRLPARRAALQELPELLAIDFSETGHQAVSEAPDSGFTEFLRLAGLRRATTRQGGRLPLLDAAAHRRRVEKIRAAIIAGDYYQANLTRQFSAPCRRPAPAVADGLFSAVRPDFGAHLRLGDLDLISISPELLVSCRNGRLTSRPVAGSRPRGKDRSADARLRRELAASGKDRAEHEMLVDLARNDLGKVARFGSVRVKRSRRIETHARVLSMVSTIEGRISEGHDGLDALWAAFPGGTISGCPKRAVSAALRRLEPCGRGFYTGSLGWLENGEGVFNILIRTLTLTGTGRERLATWGAGGGIVYDSEPEAEWRELLAKGETLQRAVTRTD